MSIERVQARHGWHTTVKAGQKFRVIDLDGHQAADLWVYSAEDPTEYLSALHSAVLAGSIYPKPGYVFHSNRRRPFVEFLEDTSGTGEHDILRPACDPYWYEILGGAPDHRSCQGNFLEETKELGLDLLEATQPVNIFTNCIVDEEGRLNLGPSSSVAGDHVTLRALKDSHIILSACPQDLLGIFGDGPSDLGFELVD